MVMFLCRALLFGQYMVFAHRNLTVWPNLAKISPNLHKSTMLLLIFSIKIRKFGIKLVKAGTFGFFTSFARGSLQKPLFFSSIKIQVVVTL